MMSTKGSPNIMNLRASCFEAKARCPLRVAQPDFARPRPSQPLRGTRGVDVSPRREPPQLAVKGVAGAQRAEGVHQGGEPFPSSDRSQSQELSHKSELRISERICPINPKTIARNKRITWTCWGMIENGPGKPKGQIRSIRFGQVRPCGSNPRRLVPGMVFKVCLAASRNSLLLANRGFETCSFAAN